MEIMGFKRTVYDFEDKLTGRPIHSEGYTLYGRILKPEADVEGTQVDAVYCNEKALEGYVPSIGDKVRIIRYGRKVVAVALLG